VSHLPEHTKDVCEKEWKRRHNTSLDTIHLSTSLMRRIVERRIDDVLCLISLASLQQYVSLETYSEEMCYREPRPSV